MHGEIDEFSRLHLFSKFLNMIMNRYRMNKISKNVPLRFRKAGRVWCGGA